jgi:hypothetical protein
VKCCCPLSINFSTSKIKEMDNEQVDNQDYTDESKAGGNVSASEKEAAETVAGAKEKSAPKKSSAIAAAAAGRSAVDRVRPHASRDIRGSSGLGDTGTIISY